MLLSCTVPFVVFLLVHFQCAFGESHIAIQLFRGKFNENMLKVHPVPPKCTVYKNCGTIDWNLIQYVQFLQPRNSSYPLKCTMRADNLKDNYGRNPAPYFEVNEEYEANLALFLFSRNPYIKKKESSYKLSIACSNGAHRCCRLYQINTTLKIMSSGHIEDFPHIIKPNVDPSGMGERISTHKNTGHNIHSPLTCTSEGTGLTNANNTNTSTSTTAPGKGKKCTLTTGKTKKSRIPRKQVKAKKVKTNNEKTVHDLLTESSQS